MALDDEPMFIDLEYRDVGEYAETGSGKRVLRITPKGSSDPVIEGEIQLDANTDYTVAVAGTIYTLFVLGRVDGMPPLMLLLSADAAEPPRVDQRLYLPALFRE